MVRRDPVPILLAVLGALACGLLLGLIPFLGALLVTILGPVFQTGVCSVYRALEQKRRASMDDFFLPAKTRLPQLLSLGAIYFVFCLVVFLMAGGIFLLLAWEDIQKLVGLAGTQVDNLDPEALRTFLESIKAQGQDVGPEIVEIVMSITVAFLWGLLVFFLLMCPVFMAYWFAPLLVAWNQLSLFRAFVFSFFAILKNWRAVLVYSLLWLVIGFVGGIVLGIFQVILLLLLPRLLAMLVIYLLLLPITIALFALGIAGIYFGYKDVFSTAPEAKEKAEEAW
ncbi:MAG: hypothetical protein LBO00_09005 [Zoogloeaceae bacterium]|nr:hypothetical protein [Zoogloeaceae bacterium]